VFPDSLKVIEPLPSRNKIFWISKKIDNTCANMIRVTGYEQGKCSLRYLGYGVKRGIIILERSLHKIKYSKETETSRIIF
jgi:hypothetical protein